MTDTVAGRKATWGHARALLSLLTSQPWPRTSFTKPNSSHAKCGRWAKFDTIATTVISNTTSSLSSSRSPHVVTTVTQFRWYHIRPDSNRVILLDQISLSTPYLPSDRHYRDLRQSPANSPYQAVRLQLFGLVTRPPDHQTPHRCRFQTWRRAHV